MLYERDTRKSADDLDVALREAAARHKFGVLAVHDLQKTLQSKGFEFARQVRVYEVCQPSEAKTVLETSLAISNALPCRISVYETEAGLLRVSTLRPTLLLKMFGDLGLESVAERVEAGIVAIIEESV